MFKLISRAIEETIKLLHQAITPLFMLIPYQKTDPELSNLEIFGPFKINILKCIRPSENNVFNCKNLLGLRLVYLREHKIHSVIIYIIYIIYIHI